MSNDLKDSTTKMLVDLSMRLTKENASLEEMKLAVEIATLIFRYSLTSPY